MPQKIVEVTCHGRARDKKRNVLEQPVVVKVRLSRGHRDGFVSVVPTDCPHSDGGHGQWCKVARNANCPFSFAFPQILQMLPKWRIPGPLVIPLGLVALPDSDD